jgi:hypothetical protein
MIPLFWDGSSGAGGLDCGGVVLTGGVSGVVLTGEVSLDVVGVTGLSGELAGVSQLLGPNFSAVFG